MDAIKLTESDIQKTCCEFLALDGWVVRRMEPVSDTSTVQQIRKAMASVAMPPHVRSELNEIIQKCLRGRGANELGMADVLAIRYRYPCRGEGCSGKNCGTVDCVTAEVLWIEYKRPGGKVTATQKAWHATERARGALVWVFGEDIQPASIEAFRAHYCASGLARKVKA